MQGLLAHVLAFDHVDIFRGCLNVEPFKYCLIMSWLVGDCQEVIAYGRGGCWNVKVCRDHCIRKWVLSSAGTVDYVWVKAGNGRFSFLLMEKVGKAVALSQSRKIAFPFLHFVLFSLFFCLPLSSQSYMLNWWAGELSPLNMGFAKENEKTKLIMRVNKLASMARQD